MPEAGEGRTRGLKRRWQARNPEPEAPALPGEQLVDRVLRVRGLADPAAAERFLSPSLLHLHDPSQIPNLDTAAEKILDAARAGRPLVIYGDYDVDGITATTILYHVLRAIAPAAPISTYVPHRIEEGYGLNEQAIRSLAADGAKAIVTVDCGITAVHEATVAKSCGVDLIITDHHNPPAPGDPLPDATIVHPRLPGSAYPFGELCGAGVAYKLAWRLTTLHGGGDRAPESLRKLLVDLLPLAAIGTIADIVPLVDENRVIASFGLTRCKHAALLGLRALVTAANLDGEKIDAEKVGFSLGPRLNACGRLGHARDAVELFTTDDPARAAVIAADLCRLNDDRRATERKIVDHAAELAEAAGMTATDRRAIVLADPEWHTGVIGIVCSRLVDRFARPTVLLQRKPDGTCSGSGRSIDGFSLHAALHECREHLTTFGGHDMAAGLSLPADGLDAFTDAFTTLVNDKLTPDDLVRSASYDAEVTLDELRPRAVAELDRLAPFGASNPPVAVRVNDLRVGDVRPLGKRGDHLAIRLDAPGGSGSVRTLAWGWGRDGVELAPGQSLDALVTPKLNHWNGRTSVEPELIDIRIHERTPSVVVRGQPSAATAARA